MNNKRTPVMLYMQTHKKLNTLRCQLEKIVETNLSFDKVIQILICVKPLEDQLIDMMLEMEPPSKTKKRS